MSMPNILLSQRHPLFYFIAVWLKRTRRYWDWFMGSKKYAYLRTTDRLPFRVKRHQSVLIRKLGDSEMYLQYNKVTNLQIALKRIAGIVIRPGETLSFCKLVGLPTKSKGYLPGMELSGGVARPGIGGGLCQLANLIYWMVIHSPLKVVERHHHSFDPFPDDGRILPFGSGATVVYNYRDLQFTNETPYTFQIQLWLSEKCLEGDLRVNTELDHTYHVFEQDHEFLKINHEYFRKNSIWRKKLDKSSGNTLGVELITRNFAKVKYTPANYGDYAP